jgi:phage terminase large subunit GpA-like protein
VGHLTLGVDVQDDRLEALYWGWGRGEEAWIWPRKVFLGNPDRDEVWQLLDAWRSEGVPHVSGHILRANTCCIDSGDHTDAVYRYVKPRYEQRVYATKGSSRAVNFLVRNKPTVTNKARVRLFMVGTECGKSILHNRLKLTVPGPRYMHFAQDVDDDFFPQLLAEVRKIVLENGRHVARWVLPRGKRAEILDMCVLNLVAFALGTVTPERLGSAVDRWASTPLPDAPPPPPEPLKPIVPNLGVARAMARVQAMRRKFR